MRFAAAIAAVAALFAVAVLGAAQMLGATDDPALPASDSVLPAGWEEHVNRRGGFAIAVPAEWRRAAPGEVRELLPALARGKRGLARTREGLFLHDLSVRSRRIARRSHFVTNAVVERAPALFARKRMWRQAVLEVRRVRGSVRSRRVRLPAGEALRLDFTMPSRSGRERIAVREFLLVEGGLQYVLTFSTARHAFRGYRATFEQSARTFRLLRADSDAAPPPPSTSAPTPIRTKREAARRAKSMLLRLSDLPPGWKGTPPDEDDDDGPCKDVGDIEAHFRTLAHAESLEFSPGVTPVVGSDVTILGSERSARQAFAYVKRVFGGPAFHRCMSLELAEADPDVRFGRARRTDLPDPGLGDRSVGWRISLPLTVKGATTTMYVDVTGMQTGQAVAGLLVLSLGAPFEAAERARLARVVAARIAR